MARTKKVVFGMKYRVEVYEVPLEQWIDSERICRRNYGLGIEYWTCLHNVATAIGRLLGVFSSREEACRKYPDACYSDDD